MSANTNTFAENMAELTKNTEDILAVAQGINEAVSGNNTEVVVNDDIVLPSYANVIKRVDRVENTIAKFTQGKGVIETDDGTFRKIKVSTISTPPDRISDVSTVTTFGLNANWFFESLQWPRCVIRIDLKGKIEDDSDRAYVKRVIIDTASMESDTVSGIISDIRTSNLSVGQLYEYLSEKEIPYYEDEDEVKLPLTYERYSGSFKIASTSFLKNEKGVSELWYYFDTVNYSQVDKDGTELDNGYILTTGDYLRYANSLYKIIEINQPQKRARLEYAVGYETIGYGDVLGFYNEPFSEKVISVGIGIDEINIVYVKGVNEEYNLLSREWSAPIAFYTNALSYEDSTNKSFAGYYADSVVDFGKEWIAQAKEGRKNAYNGITPNAPVIDGESLAVKQINTQLNATLDQEKYNNLTSDIASTKTNIKATRDKIAINKDKLLKIYDDNERNNIQSTISTDTDTLNTLTTHFSSAVDELNTLLNDTGAIGYSPKYHVRGFFAIPEPKYGYIDPTTGEKHDKQQVIGFDVMYRYIHTDETGVQLDTFEYTDANDASNPVKATGVFSDWNLKVSSFLEKVKDPDSGVFIWKDEAVDGTAININQIDIPIRKGEKVEIKVRSISECGYPYNPLKSEWSNSVIVAFPDTLTTDDSVTTILESVRGDMTSVVLQETLSSAGMYTHIADANSIYKHSADNIMYIEKTVDENGNTVATPISLYDKIKSLEAMISSQSTSNNSVEIEYTDASNGMKITRKIPETISTEDSSLKRLNDTINERFTTIIKK